MKRGPPPEAAQQAPAAAPKPSGPALLNRRDIDVPDELESAWRACWNELQGRIANSSESDAVSFLQIRAGESQERHNEVVSGLLFSIFTAPQMALLHWKWLSMCQRDDWDFCIDQLKRLAAEKFHKLMEPCKKQLMWIIQELIRARARNVDGVFSGLLRHVAGGDYSPKNTQLAASLLKMLQDNKAWLYASPRLISTVFYTFTRLITDHSKQAPLSTLRQQELSFTSTLLREKFEECRVIGRDLIRLIDEVRKFPEFEVIWKDLLHKPTSFSPTLTSITDILSVRTPPKYLTSRLTPDMESQLMFMLKNVKMGNQKRYQTWFMQKYMSAADSETLVPDLIRYICCNYHPPNHVLCSDIVPRWAIIGWLLKCVKTKFVGNSAKLALFWDWFSFDPRSDNIMNIEPAILLMMHSIPKYSDITATLLDFLASTIDSLEEQRRDFSRKGVHNSFSVCLSKNVVPSLAPLYNCPALDPSIRVKLHPILRPFLKEDEAKQLKPPSTSSSPVIPSVGSPTLNTSPTLPSSPIASPQKSPVPVTANLPKLPFPQLSETESLGRKGSALDNFDIMPLISPKRQPSPTEELYSRPESGADEATEEQELDTKSKTTTRTDIPTSLLEVERPLGKLIDSLNQENFSRSFEVQSTNMHHLIAHFVKMSSGAKYSQEAATDLAQLFADSLAKEFTELSTDTVFSTKPSLHHNLFSADPSLPFALLDILHELRLLVPSLGSRFLIWLIVHGIKGIERRRGTRTEDQSHEETSWVDKVDKGYQYMSELNDDVLEPYVAFIEHSVSKGTTESQEHPFLMDCKVCAEESMDVFIYIVPYLFRYLTEYIDTYRVELVQLIVSNVDPTHIGPLMCKLTAGEFEMFGTRADDVAAVLDQSLGLDSISQFCMWQLLSAEFNFGNGALEEIVTQALDLLKVQDRAQSQEFMQGLLGVLRIAAPSSTLLQAVLSLPLSSNKFSSAVLSQWSSRDVSKFFPVLFSELQRVIAKGANVKDEDQEQREDMDTGSRGRVDRKYAKRVAGHVDKWCMTMKTDLKRRVPDTNNLSVLSSLIQRVIRIHGLPSDKYDGLATLMERNNPGRADERHGGDSRKRKRTSSGSTPGPSSLSATIGGETAAEREKRLRAAPLKEEPIDHKKRRLSAFDTHPPEDTGELGHVHEGGRERPPIAGELKRRDTPAILFPGRHVSLPQQQRPGGQHPPPISSGARHDSRLAQSTGGIPRRASNGALDETRSGREDTPNRKRSLSGSSAQPPSLEGDEGAKDDKDASIDKTDGSRKRKVKRISMDHEPEYDQ